MVLRVAPVCVATKKNRKLWETAVSYRWQKMLVKKVENMGKINVTEIGRDFNTFGGS